MLQAINSIAVTEPPPVDWAAEVLKRLDAVGAMASSAAAHAWRASVQYTAADALVAVAIGGFLATAGIVGFIKGLKHGTAINWESPAPVVITLVSPLLALWGFLMLRFNFPIAIAPEGYLIQQILQSIK